MFIKNNKNIMCMLLLSLKLNFKGYKIFLLFRLNPKAEMMIYNISHANKAARDQLMTERLDELTNGNCFFVL